MSLDERYLRMANAALPLLSGLSILPIALDQTQRWSRTIGLWLVSIPLVLILWADLPIDGWYDHGWSYLQRSMIAMAILGWVHWGLTSWLVGKLDWPARLYSSSWTAFALAAAIGLAMLVSEPLHWWKLAAASMPLAVRLVWLVAWASLIGRAIQLALRPIGLDGAASLKARQAMVFGIELGLSLFAWATYQCFPELFAGVVAQWWPLIVYGIAMLSAGVGHWATIRRHEVLADPVRRSSLLLPLIPLLGVWMPFARHMEVQWHAWDSYALILLSGAAVYALHGWLKPSVKVNAVACLLMLLSFWALLHSRPGLHFVDHPQFWIVPPALVTLIFVEANRRRLDPGLVTAVRYTTILLAYLSSTSEIVLKAFEGQMWQPLVLLILAVLGVLAGIALRVRAFLF
jgi:hypothetical protein